MPDAVSGHPLFFPHALSQWYLPEWVVLPLPLSGISQDRTVSSGAPLGGEIGKQQKYMPLPFQDDMQRVERQSQDENLTDCHTLGLRKKSS